MSMKPKFQKSPEIKKKTDWKCIDENPPVVSSDRLICFVLIDKKVQAAYLQNGQFNKNGVTHYIMSPKELPHG